MRRALFKFACVLSLVLCIAFVLLWISTYVWSAQIEAGVARERGGQIHPIGVELLTSRGELTLLFTSDFQFSGASDRATQSQVARARDFFTRRHFLFQPLGASRSYFAAPNASLSSLLGFRFDSHRLTTAACSMQWTVCDMPIWPLVLLFAILPAARPVRRMIHAVRLAPARAKTTTDRRIAALAITCLVLFIAMTATAVFTGAAGLSMRFARRGGTLVDLGVQNRRLHLRLIDNWPEAQPLSLVRLPDNYHLLYPFREGNTWLIQSQGLASTSWSHGSLPLYADEDGSLARLPYGKNPYFLKNLGGFPFQQFQVSLFDLGLPFLLVFAVWAVVRVRAAMKRFVAARDSMCTRCGYPLAGNESGVCPECGETISGGDAEIAEKTVGTP